MGVRRFVIPVTIVLLAGSFVVAQGAHAGRVECFGMPATIVGTNGPDTLRGTPGPDVIVGLDGDDLLIGDGGPDKICGGAGDDELLGSAGADKLNEQGGYGLLQGGKGNDLLKGGPGGASARYDHAEDRVVIDLAAGTVKGEGQDRLRGIQDAGGSAFNDVIRGSGGDNLLQGQDGNDRLFGRGGDDYVLPGAGDDLADGGPGLFDVVGSRFAPGPVNADLKTGTSAGEGTDVLRFFEGLEGGPSNDFLTGNELDNGLFGGPGNDALSGAAGNDFLDGEEGTDTADGGPGEDGCHAEEVQNCEETQPTFGKRVGYFPLSMALKVVTL